MTSGQTTGARDTREPVFLSGVRGMSKEQVLLEIRNGGRFISYMYCLSLIVMSYRTSTPPRLVRSGASKIAPGWPYILLSLIIGWWGIPWGPIYTVQSLATNFRGGTDETDGVKATLESDWPVIYG